MTPREIWEKGLKDNLFSDKIAGKTPYQTIKSKISVHIRKNGENSIFIRTKPGHFYLRSLMTDQQTEYEAPPLQPRATSERVLVFRSKILDDLGVRFQGIKTSWKQLTSRLIQDKYCFYVERYEAEQNPNLKQVLTYVIVSQESKVLSFVRGTFTHAAKYLRGSRCIGFGGHVAENDRNIFNLTDYGIKSNAVRELTEELELPNSISKNLTNKLELIGVLNDDSNDVGRKHFAFLFRLNLNSDESWPSPKRGERAVAQLGWIDVTSGMPPLHEFEYWSQLCLRKYFPQTLRAQPAFRITRKSKRIIREKLCPPHILCITGPIGSGKSQATQVFTEEHNYKEINTGKILADILKIAPVPKTNRKIFQKKAWDFIVSIDGPQILASTIIERVNKIQHERILIDGIRQIETLDHLLSMSEKPVGIIYIQTPPDAAYRFFANRFSKPPSIDKYIELLEAPVEQDVGSMISRSDVVIYNWNGQISFRSTINRLIKELNNLC